MKTSRLILTASALATAAIIAAGCDSSSKEDKVRQFDQLSGKTIVVQKGTTFDEMLAEKYPSYNVKRVSTFIDIYSAVVSGEADYGIDEDVTASLILSSGLAIDTVHADIPAVPMGAIFHKSNTELQAQFNDFINELESSGKLSELRTKWFGSASPSSLPVPHCNVTEGKPLRVITEGDYPPFNLTISGSVSGFDVELCTLFAEKLGRPLVVTAMAFDDIIPFIAKGKADMSIAGISITEERAKQVLFSVPYNYTYTTIVSSKTAKKLSSHH
ncbi:MAG: transporter substrate-binding domain-containing protein [Bacteroidales bacterium]|nr:transporter substrate-binding domain-containing protein [Bacteroidales bacterium]